MKRTKNCEKYSHSSQHQAAKRLEQCCSVAGNVRDREGVSSWIVIFVLSSTLLVLGLYLSFKISLEVLGPTVL